MRFYTEAGSKGTVRWPWVFTAGAVLAPQTLSRVPGTGMPPPLCVGGRAAAQHLPQLQPGGKTR